MTEHDATVREAEDESARRKQAIDALIVQGQRVMQWAVISEGVLIVALAIVVGVLVYRASTESHRVAVAVSQQVGQIRQNAVTIARQQKKIEQQTRSSCAFDRDVASAPVSPASTVLGVKIVVDARVAFLQSRCTGDPLPPVDPLLVKLAGKYHIRVPAGH